jgi:hypothetical protein
MTEQASDYESTLALYKLYIQEKEPQWNRPHEDDNYFCSNSCSYCHCEVHCNNVMKGNWYFTDKEKIRLENENPELFI